MATIARAADEIQRRLGSALVGFSMSRMFRTPAVGGPTGQPPFINSVAALELRDRSAWDVWHVVREVEQLLGRVRQERWEARRIDLDVLLFDDQRIWTQHFKLPHPRMIMRRFILEPALDVAADWVEPVSQLRLDALAKNLRHSPASILLITGQPERDQSLMENAAAVSRCQWLTPDVVSPTSGAGRRGGERLPQPVEPGTRWLGIVPICELVAGCSVAPQPRVAFVLTPPTASEGGAWEDIHRGLAGWMRLCDVALADEPAGVPPWPLLVPGYLLSTDDRQWSQHEIVAALDAMDCPVEAH